MNGVKEAGTNSSEGLSPGRCPTEEQGGTDRHRTNPKGGRRRKWSQEANRIAMECYYSSNQDVVGYREKMYMIWKEKGMFGVMMGVVEESDKNGCEGSVGFGEEENVLCQNECHVVLEDTCLNQDGYSNNDRSEVVTKLALKHGRVLQGDKNEIFEQLIIFVYKKEKEQLKSLRGIPKAKVKCAVNKVNYML